MRDDLPEIAVGLLSYNRADEVVRTLRLLEHSDYPAKKLHRVVIDNASTDGTRERILAEFGDRVEVVRLTENIGAIARNEVILKRTEKYIFQFDEDTSPADMSTLRDTVEWMESHPSIGALCFRSLNIHTGLNDWGPLEVLASRRLGERAFEGLFMIGNGMCFRRSEVQRTDGYDPRLFWGAEEISFALELLYHEVATAYHPDLVILHRQPPRSMARAQVVEMEVRNNIRAYVTFMPLLLGIAMSLLHYARRLMQAANNRDRGQAAGARRGFRRVLSELREVLAARRPIPMSRLARHNRWLFHTIVGLGFASPIEGDEKRIQTALTLLAD